MKKINVRGIRFKTVIYFLIFSVLILAMIWLLQIVFLKTYYQGMKKQEIEKAGLSIVNSYEEEDFVQKLADTAFKNELSVLVFRVNGNIAEILYIAGASGDFQQMFQLNQQLTIFINKLNEGKPVVSYISDERKGFETLTYGQVKSIDGEDIYFYVNASLVPIESTIAVLINQLIIITGICLVLSIIISVYVSKRIAKPITEITGNAEKMGKGNFDVTFKGGGFKEIESLAKTLNYAAVELAKTDNLRKDLIANVSHELRTPLTLVKAYAELIRDISGSNEDKRLEHIDIILSEAERLKNLVSDMLDLSKLQSNTAVFNKTEFDLSKIFREIAGVFSGIYEKENYNFILDIEDGVNIYADKVRVEQVLYNLIGNAVNYSTDNKNITLKLRNLTDGVRLDIVDNGIGIAKEDQAFVFDKFFKTEQVERTKSGSGLGLFIVKNILEQHGFEFGVDSELSKGSDFYIIFK